MIWIIHNQESPSWTFGNSRKKSDRTSTIFEASGLRDKKAAAEEKSKQEGLWDDPKKAEKVLKELKYWTDLEAAWQELSAQAQDLEELSQMVEEGSSESAELATDFEKLEQAYQKAHVELVLSGPYDQNDAILVLSAGTGGVDAMDWTEMLLRMYLRYAEKKGWKTEVTEKTVASEAGIKSATIEVSGMMAYGFLKAEHGVQPVGATLPPLTQRTCARPPLPWWKFYQ